MVNNRRQPTGDERQRLVQAAMETKGTRYHWSVKSRANFSDERRFSCPPTTSVPVLSSGWKMRTRRA